MKKLLIACILLIATAVSVTAAEHSIPYPEGTDLISAGASAYMGVCNLADSPYFSKHDFYNMEKRPGLYLLRGFRTYQQTKEMSSAPACALTVLDYFGEKNYTELGLVEKIGTHLGFSENGEIGTDVYKLGKFFKNLGWEVTTSIDTGAGNAVTCPSRKDFKKFVINALKNDTPIMVENMYMGGKWRVIIGYDTMNTPAMSDDVLIFMNPYDVFDHSQDGYSVESVEYFYFTWLDIGLMPRGQQMQPWVKARPAEKKIVHELSDAKEKREEIKMPVSSDIKEPEAIFDDISPQG